MSGFKKLAEGHIIVQGFATDHIYRDEQGKLHAIVTVRLQVGLTNVSIQRLQTADETVGQFIDRILAEEYMFALECKLPSTRHRPGT